MILTSRLAPGISRIAPGESSNWVQDLGRIDGTSVVRPVWNGRANLVQFEADGPVAGHIENLSLRLYDPQFHQWSLYYSSSKSGTLSVPTIGKLKNGRGEFFDMELLNGKTFWF